MTLALEALAESPFQETPERSKYPHPKIAYLSAEFGVNEKLPIYSGGLGVLSGDQLKASSDLGLDVVAFGLAYNYGYFRQQLDDSGWQQENYPRVDFGRAEAHVIRGENGNSVQTHFPIENRTVRAQIRRAMVGKVPLYIFDTDIEENTEPNDRWITGMLYGGDHHTRVRQESALAFGAYNAIPELIKAGVLDKAPDLWHMNEGHAAFLAMALAKKERELDPEIDWKEAMDRASKKLIFTSHTPVPAGIDKFPTRLVREQLGTYLIDLGNDPNGKAGSDFFAERANHVPGQEPGESWCQLHLGFNAGRTNGVSEENALVVNHNWGHILKDIKRPQAVGVLNGVHSPSWTDPELQNLVDEDSQRFVEHHYERDYIESQLSQVSDADLIAVKQGMRGRLVDAVNQRRAERVHTDGRSFRKFDNEVFTLEYARRFATYKRNVEPFNNPEVLKQLLTDENRPMQMVISGKAHPHDEPGKGMIQTIYKAIHVYPEIADHVEFIEDYDIGVARGMVRGADYWANFPRVPHEASGTSGMKALLNGGKNGSTGTGYPLEMDPDLWDHFDEHFVEEGEGCDEKTCQLDCPIVANSFYEAVKKAKTEFYGNGFRPSEAWMSNMRGNIVEGNVKFSASRMMLDYNKKLYLPMAHGLKD